MGTCGTDLADLAGRLPVVGERRLALRVTRDAHRQLRSGSPWLYDGSITSVGHRGEPGDLAVVFDDQRRFTAIGLWDPTSPIRVKVLHQGKPVTIDEAWWRDRLAAALARRQALAADGSTTGYRCVNGENDGLPGLIVDRYADTLVVKLYSPAWFPHLAVVSKALCDLVDPERIVLRLGRSVARGQTFALADGDTIVGPVPDGPVTFREGGLVMEADVVRGQKTGHFLDQRDNRALVRELVQDRVRDSGDADAEGVEVLDVFASTGGFSLAAAAGGARSVHLVDQSAPALATAARNIANNRELPTVAACRVDRTVGDAFEVLERLGAEPERFDVVIVDPPSFASNQDARARALAAYGRLTGLAVRLVRPGGTLVQSSCSSRVGADEFEATVLRAARAAGVGVRLTRRTGHAVDHPIGFEFGEYLKTVFLTVMSPPGAGC